MGALSAHNNPRQCLKPSTLDALCRAIAANGHGISSGHEPRSSTLWVSTGSPLGMATAIHVAAIGLAGVPSEELTFETLSLKREHAGKIHLTGKEVRALKKKALMLASMEAFEAGQTMVALEASRPHFIAAFKNFATDRAVGLG